MTAWLGLNVRLIFDPFYRVTDPGSSFMFSTSTLNFPPKAYTHMVDNYADKPGIGYVLLLCSTSGSSNASVKGSLVLQGNARLTNPVILEKLGPSFLPPTTEPGSSFKTYENNWKDIQAFPFKVTKIEKCGPGSLQLASGDTFYQRGGRDVESGFTIVGMNQAPAFSSGTFWGIQGPNRMFTTPFIGGAPSLGIESGFESLPEQNRSIITGMPAEAIIRYPAPGLSYASSQPESAQGNGLDVSSDAGTSVQVYLRNDQSQQHWQFLTYVSDAYLALGLGVIAAIFYDWLISPRRTGKTTQRMAAEAKLATANATADIPVPGLPTKSHPAPRSANKKQVAGKPRGNIKRRPKKRSSRKRG